MERGGRECDIYWETPNLRCPTLWGGCSGVKGGRWRSGVGGKVKYDGC